jgi:phenylpropionate dioxygenase-like ring-hydroxylating dioxygenase large terminal subunit
MMQREYTPADVPQWRDILSRDTRQVPKSFYFENKVDYGVDDIGTERYVSADFFRLEVERLWRKVWQFAAFEDDIPKVGDYITYEIAGLSIIITRSGENQFSAFYNACLHRAAQLAQGQGHARRFVCPFHGWAYGLDGALQRVPAQWDFPQVCEGKDRIRPVRVESYNGILFVCMDADAPPLLAYLDPLPEFLANFPIKGRRQRVAWVRKIVPGNWKNAVEAFQEGYHLPITHSQFAKTLPGIETQTDIIGPHVSRLTGPSTVPNCITGPELSEQEVLDLATEGLLGPGMPKLTVPEGMTARAVLAEATRAMLKQRTGLDTAAVSDVEIIDHELFHVFPNSVIWGSWSMPIMYRWRPNGDDHRTAIFEVFMFLVYPEGADIPPPAPVVDLGIDQPFAAAEPLGGFGAIVDQDVGNMILQARGLASTPERGLKYGRSTEMLIRHFNHLLDEMLAKPEGVRA